MILTMIGLLFGAFGIFIFMRIVNKESEKLYIGKSIVCALSAFLGMMLITFGFCGARIDEGERNLKNTNYAVIQSQDDSMYEVYDEENNILYYFEESQVEVLKDGKRGMYGNKIIYDCKILEGNYDQPYIEEYEVDYKMNWWSFELTNTTEYILYIPQSMLSE